MELKRFVRCNECDKRIDVTDAVACLTEDIGIPGSEFTTYLCKPCHKYIIKWDHNRIRLMELKGEMLF